MNKVKKFVCGFYGARDNYEVPAALQEAGLLDVLLTDFYGDGGLVAKRWRPKAVRQHELLPPDRVHGSAMLLMTKQISGRLFADPERRNLWPDALLSRRIAREAERRDGHIITYEPYAVTRPAGGFPKKRKQVVFYYHPHVDTEDAIYREDETRWPAFYGEVRVTKSPWRRRTADAWKQADLVLCASSFTKQSLVDAGMEEERIVVVPYGTARPKAEVTSNESLVTGGEERPEARGQRSADGGWMSETGCRRPKDRGANPLVGESLPVTRNSPCATGSLRLLFVGRNPLRKGLHHLLMAWNAANKRSGDLLTIVCAARPLEMRRLIEGRDDVRWLETVSGEDLAQLYRDSDALVVPSLCEGFGHVYLEAMGHGCAAVGTRNSALPDIGDEKQGVLTIGVGDVDGLTRLISEASSDPSIFRSLGGAAKQRASEFTWERFRQGIVSATRSLATADRREPEMDPRQTA